jgi:hypothetical protein
VQDLAAANGQRLVLEQDDSLVRSDQAVLYAAVRDVGASQRLTYEHVPARSEPLLWVADAAAWCWSRGGIWLGRLQPIIRHTAPSDPTGARSGTAQSPAHPPSGRLPGSLHGATAPCLTIVRLAGRPHKTMHTEEGGSLRRRIASLRTRVRKDVAQRDQPRPAATTEAIAVIVVSGHRL